MNSGVISCCRVGGCGEALSAITVQPLADLGYVVDVTEADDFKIVSKAGASVAAGVPVMPDVLTVGHPESAEWTWDSDIDFELGEN